MIFLPVVVKTGPLNSGTRILGIYWKPSVVMRVYLLLLHSITIIFLPVVLMTVPLNSGTRILVIF